MSDKEPHITVKIKVDRLNSLKSLTARSETSKVCMKK